MENQKHKTIQKGIKMAIDLFHGQGFQVMDVHADKEFNAS